MNIEFIGLNKALNIDEYAIREITESYIDDAETSKKQTHFQALISGNKISKGSIVNCLFKYYGENNQFLGLDKQEIWLQEKEPYALSVHINIPDGTVLSTVYFEVRKDYWAYIAWIWGIGIFFIIFLGVQSLIDLFN